MKIVWLFFISMVAGSFTVHSLPGIEAVDSQFRPKMYAGQLPISENDSSELFFWLFQNQRSNTDKLIIWLNGGPGCSSMDGALMEIGPFRVAKDGSLTYNSGTWLHDADLLFVDQPKGTGLSTSNGTYDADLGQVSADFWSFYGNFLQKFPDLKHKKVYLAGESYAGQYIPFLAHTVLANNAQLSRIDQVKFMVNNAGIAPQFPEEKALFHNKAASTVSLNATINLQGLLIGNGYIYPDVQSLSYFPYALQYGLITTNNVEQYNAVAKPYFACKAILSNTNSNDTLAPFSHPICTEEILESLLKVTRAGSNGSYTCYNMYDRTLRSPYPSCGMEWPFDLPQVTSWLRNETVLKSLNVGGSPKWKECGSKVSNSLLNFNTTPSYFLLDSLLDRVPIVLYNGDNDIICNHPGVEKMTNDLHWGNKTGWSGSSVYSSMYLNDKVIGQVKSERNLTLMSIHNASHMAPYDNSYNTRVVFNYLLGNYNEKKVKNDKVVVFPQLNRVVDESHINIVFVIVIATCLVITWSYVLFLRFTTKNEYLRLE